MNDPHSTEKPVEIMLIERQKEIGAGIENLRSNAVKYGSKRTIENHKRILDEIERLSSEFLLNDVKLHELAANDPSLLEQPYFRNQKRQP